MFWDACRWASPLTDGWVAIRAAVVYVPLGQPAHRWLGLLLLLMLAFRLGTGKRCLKAPFAYRRKNDWALALVAALHAFGGPGLWFFASQIGP